MAQPQTAAPAVPAHERGATRVADRVVAKIASRAAREALSGFDESAALVTPGRTAPRARASVRPAFGRGPSLGDARLHIGVELGYPSDIGAQCGAVRRVVTERVGGLAGMKVHDVVVTVERLHSPHTRGEGRGRVR
ncbi:MULTISPECIES: hypothetical protein [Streptomyces]|uniref:Asp23/Gls24 family envelope stress response protein n=2 Tax=Streptomyces TaxID=1883 RepID=A0A3M8EWR2_9ACTN|nr:MULTISPECIES: hypothetical protein [Streptomyces]KNE81919.1 hypothetical protein ADZ36_13565 [Streptomyces fradiae]OFA51574.1 hypothetical protein BEN35_13495 [Streptomyces fradiae]PQM19416.1 hypothetical protein Sfr7A_32310 [Streptomyces xinghaiensis]RKM95965.1 Asp23/Gls24 family envelope stress response protein [Streptomyces xinghaiensis]RNC69921.1 Asp23/Gls24 family envelope stress response protein [Streptomyces xinghaiensis]